MREKELTEQVYEADDGTGKQVLEEGKRKDKRHKRWGCVVLAGIILAVIGGLAAWSKGWLGDRLTVGEKENRTDEYVVADNARMTKNYDILGLDWSNSAGVVNIDTVWDIHVKFLNMHQEDSVYYTQNIEEFRDTFHTYMLERKTDIFDTADCEKEQLTSQRYLVTNASGEIAFYCYGQEKGSQDFVPTLISLFTGEKYILGEGTEDTLSVFLNDVKERQQEVVETAEYVLRTLEADQYGGLRYDTEKRALCVWLADESKRDKLEAKNVICKTAVLTLDEQYEKIWEIWQHQEACKLVDVYWSYETDKIVVVSTETEERVQKELEDFGDIIAYEACSGAASAQTYPQVTGGYSGAWNITDLDVFIAYLKELDAVDGAYTKERTEYYKKLRIALKEMKKEYPDYTYLQLYYHVAADCDYEWYLDFDEELEEFVQGLREYHPEYDRITELEFGDKDRLELKGLLRAYKELEPEKSYAEIYETYEQLRTIEYDKYMSSQQSLYLRLMDKYAQKEKVMPLLEKKKAAEKEKKTELAVIIGGVLAVGLLGGLFIRRMRSKSETEE